MQRQLSNVSFHSYQEYQPSRRYGAQYEPGGYSAAVQQRSNMTQREDALKFEQGRIKALQEERLHIQKKTFTKWINSFLQKARMEVEDLFVDLADGRKLLKLLEIISGERLPRPNTGRMRVHKIENVNKSLSFLHTKVRLESIGAEDIVDGNPRLILGLIWTIILRFQIQEIEIDVDEENESSEKKSAKDALLLWCQRKTSGYHGVHIHNFTDSWRSGLGFNALIHAHRPDLFRWNEVPVADHVETLNHAFDVAHNHLGIPRLLDAEDVDISRPDEKSVMTYVASYYHTFARMKNEQKSGRRIANIIGQLVDCDSRKTEYSKLVTALLEWIRLKIQELNGRDLPNSLDGIQRLLLAFKQYRTVEKPPKYKERSEIEALYFDINTMQKSLVGEAWAPLEGQLPQDLERAWQQLEQAEHAREIALRTELLRQQRLEQLNYKFNTKSVLRKGYLKEMIQVLSDPRYGSNLAQVDATVKKHEAISADILARTERFEDLSAMAAELVKENYHGAETVSRTEQAVLARWRELLELLEKHRVSLGLLAKLMALLREADTVRHTLVDMKAQFQSEEVGRHLVDVERLLQAHALQELQLGAVDESIRRLVRHGASAEGPPQPTRQLAQQLAHLEDAYDSLVAAAKDRKARLEDARNLFQFLEDHDEEEGWVTDKQRICRADVAAKDLRGVLALRQKHTALLHELRAREHVSQRHRAKGQSLIDAKHPKSAEIERRLTSLNKQWEVLRELAEAREKQLADAAEAHQFYGDANEAESWMKEKRPLVATEDCGNDAPSAGALLARHRLLHDEIRAHAAELQTLGAHAERLHQAGIRCLQLPTEVESTPAIEEEEWVNESRLVPTEVWEEEPVERLEHRTVTEERQVPQVKALYAFTGQGISMQKGEVMFLINKTNPDWWSVRKADRTDGFVPANYVREIEPRVVPVQVRRPEKVRTVQRVKKTVLVKQVVPVKRNKPAARRASRAQLPQQRAVSVETRMADIQKDYDELLTLSAARRAQLEDAIKLYSFFAECDDFDKWMKEKEKMLKTDDAEDSVDTAKRKYEKFVTDLSAASKRLEHIDEAAEDLVAAKHSQASKAVARRQQLRQQWDRLLRLKQQKEKSLEGASSVELFSRTCDEALDWMAEKEQQLAGGSDPAADLRTVRALQRRHAQLERELEPLREKVNTVSLLADSLLLWYQEHNIMVKSQYPTERGNVEARQKEIHQMWERCQAQAAERRSRLESAVGHQIFGNSSAQLQTWLQKVRDQLSQEATAKDVATAEALDKQHQELMDDIKAHDDEFKEVIGLGKQLLATNPNLTDVADRIKSLENEQKAIAKEWKDKDVYLKQLVQLQCFNREADQIDASTGAHEAYLENKEFGSSVDEAEALVKRHEELEARLAAQDERVSAFTRRATALQKLPHYAADHIGARKDAVVSRRDAVRQSAAERRRGLLASLAYQQFAAATEELQAWIGDKTRTAKDQSYRDLVNLERKLQKHEAFERELQANEKQLRNVESIGQSLQKSDPARADDVSERLDGLHTAWEGLVAASRDKGSKLRQAAAQRQHRRSVEDAKARLMDLERALKSEEIGTDLRSCKRLLNQHQALEQELSQWEQKGTALAAQGADLVSAGHFDGPAIEKDSQAVLQAVRDLQPAAAARRHALESNLQLYKFAAEVAGELDWLAERQAAASSETTPSDLHAAQSAQKKHLKLRAELTGRRPLIERVLVQGRGLVEDKHPQSDKITELCGQLENAYSEVSRAAETRAGQLEASLKAQQFLHDALELDSWLADKAAALASPDVGSDRHRATQLLTRHKAVELELDTYAAIISEMGHVATSMAQGHPEGEALVSRHEALADSLARLQRLAAQRQNALVESVCRHEYLAESAELESWIQEQYAAASSEDYGQDYEHLQILRSKFEELRHRVESGAERFNQCEELARKLLATDSPYIADIEKRQEALGESWQRLVDQIQSRASRLHAAGEIHRFHRDVGELVSRAADKRAALADPPAPRDLRAATKLLRDHETIQNDLVAIDAQMQVLQEEGSRLQKLYPGGNVQQIGLQQQALSEAWAMLKQAADERKHVLQQHLQLHQFLTQVRDLSSWCVGVRTTLARAVRVHDAASAQAARGEHAAARAELDARDDSFTAALALGRELVDARHPNAQEVEEKCEALLEERARVERAWAARQVALDQLIDLHCFLRDAKQLHDLCASQEAALSTEISPTSSVEEVDHQLKKHEAFEKLLATQDEKLATLNSHGDKLLQQNHVESQRIADELQTINERRKKLYVSAQARRARLVRVRARAQFARDAGEARAWVADKLAKLSADSNQGEVTNLEDKIKKLQKHQAFTAELAANKARLQEVEELAQQLSPDEEVQKQLQALHSDWKLLEQATEQKGRGLEEAQDILEFNQHLDKFEAWIRDKEMMVQAHELGRDYEHCSALLRKLDDMDSDMKVDDKRVKSISALADKLLQQGPTQQAATVSQRRDCFLAKWKALSGALQRYRDNLSAALEIHSFNRDVEDTAERIAKKAAIFSSSERGRELAAAQELKRKHLARAAEARAVLDKIQALETEGRTLAHNHPERAKEIDKSLQSLREGWDNLQKLAEKRTALLDEAIAEHKFDESLKELELWVSETVKHMDETTAPETVPEAEALLELHQEKKTEIDNRQKAIASLQKEAEQVQAPEKMKKVTQLSTTLDKAWLQRKEYLNQAHQLQLLKEQARQTEDWLASKEAFLNNDDLGENLDAVETLIRKHAEFAKLLESQVHRVEELEKLAGGVLQQGHGHTLVEKRVHDVLLRLAKLKESCKQRGDMLEQSRQLHEFLQNLHHEREWIALKMQAANDQNYKELSNLQSKIQKHAAFESELAASKGRIDDVANQGEALIESKHYASQEISKHVEQLENQWRELQAAAKLRRERLQEAYQARVYLRGLDDFTAWLDDVESQLLSEDHGKDLASVTGLLKRHTRLEQQVSGKGETAAQLAETARHLADNKHFMAQEILEKAENAVKRYRQLQEPMQIRRDNLEDAALLHRWERDADEEFRWLDERQSALNQEELGSTLQETQALLKKHLALEGEIIAREPAVKAVSGRAAQLSRSGHFASAVLESRALDLSAALRDSLHAAESRAAALRQRSDLLQLASEISEAEMWLLERRPALVSSEVGRDEDSALGLGKRLEALQRELTAFDSTVSKLEKAVAAITERGPVDTEQVSVKMNELKTLYEDMKLLSAKRQQRLHQSLKYFKFVQECEEVQEWIGEQMAMAASEEYGLDVEHVETLQQAFDNFLAQLQSNEGRIEAVCEAGNVLLEENAPETDKVKQRIDDIKGLWDDLKELALARQEALAGARQVHEFDRSADEAAAWIAEKESALGGELAPRSHHELHAQTRSMHALRADLDAIRARHEELREEADRLGTAFPDAKEHVTAKLEDVTEALEALAARADQCSHQLELAGQLQAYFGTYQELLAWTNEMIARVTAPELAAEVPAAERLVARHRDLKVEIDAKEDAFRTLYNDGEKLVKEGHFMSVEIEDRMSILRSRRAVLDSAWATRDRIYVHHLDALVFLKDAMALDNWITNRVPLVRDGKYGESVVQVEELINKHRDLEETIEAQRDKFNALKRITLVEQAFKEQQNAEEAARRRSAERQEAERLQQYRKREMERITEERRRETAPPVPIVRETERVVTSLAPASSEETLSPAPQFERLPKNDPHVKRAESMSVVKTPKRTPSFTTRRRTQSFRRHRRGDAAELPPVEIEGYLERKQEAGCGGKRATVRSWRSYYSVLCGQLLCFFRDELDFASSKAAAPPVAILNARCDPAGDYTKRANVFRLSCADGAEYLFACNSKDLMRDWVAKLSFHAQLPPELQLTPYSAAAPGESPTAELRRRLHENASSSSSAASSPEPQRRTRTQAEILQEHRNSKQTSQRASATPERNIESAVLPSLPPRQPPPQEEDMTEVVLRSTEQTTSSWGKTRFSNGRDINMEFIRSQRDAEMRAPSLPVSELPAERPPIVAERPPALPERGPNLPERVPNIPERGPNLPERMPGDRNSNQAEKQSVTALVNSYQQRMSGNWQGRDARDARDANKNWQQERGNNNYQNVETTHFYSSSEIAYGGSSAGSTRPASVAGSGGSPALDQRPASRSSGESELSVSGVSKEKKDKKGVFGGLFSRKKRPQSHM